MRGFYKCIIYKFNLILITLNKQVYIAGNTNFFDVYNVLL